MSNNDVTLPTSSKPSPPPYERVSQSVSVGGTLSNMQQRPKLKHLRSSTFDEKSELQEYSPEEPDSFTRSDTSQMSGWVSSRTKVVPQSVPTNPTYKFSLQGRPGEGGYGVRQKRVPGLSRAETVGVGLGLAPPPPPPPDSGAPECSICFHEFEDDGLKVPRLLGCGHCYCTGCLDEQLLHSRQSNPVITCPQCKAPTPVEDGQIESLKKNFSLIEVVREYPKSVPNPSTLSRSKSPEPTPVVIRCEEHGDSLSSFCTKCGVLVCSTCLLYGTHRDHHNKTMFVSEAASMYRKKLLDLSPEVRKQRQKMEGVLADVEKMNESVQERGGKLVEEAERVYNELIDLIEQRRDALKVEIMERTQIRAEALTEQASDLKECIEKAAAVQHTTEKLLRSDEYTLLHRAVLTMDEIEGVFVNPPPSIPKAQDDLRCEFSSGPRDEIASNLVGYGTVRPDVGTISHLYVKPYHDGFRIQWDGHNFADNEGTTYYLQKAIGADGEFTALWRGFATKYNYKTELTHGQKYRFRVQVRTTEGVGNWSDPVEAVKAAPDFRWHELWRNVKIDLFNDKLEAAWTKGGSHNFWATFAGDRPFLHGQHYFEIDILDLGKGKSQKKLAFGIIGTSKSRAGSLPWQDGKHPIGQWEVPSWAFQPMSGAVYSQDMPDGVKYGSDITLQNGDRFGMLVNLNEGKITYFINGRDLGVAFDDLDLESMLPAVSIRDRIRVCLRFPPPPYLKRNINFVKMSSRGHSMYT